MKMPVIPAERPIQRIPNDRFPMNPYGIQEYFMCFATLLFTAIHVAGWSFDFPNRVERLLWRISSLMLFGITAAFWLFETAASWARLGRWKTLYLFVFNRKGLAQHRIRMAQRTATIKRQSKQLPLPLGVCNDNTPSYRLWSCQILPARRSFYGTEEYTRDGVCKYRLDGLFTACMTNRALTVVHVLLHTYMVILISREALLEHREAASSWNGSNARLTIDIRQKSSGPDGVVPQQAELEVDSETRRHS